MLTPLLLTIFKVPSNNLYNMNTGTTTFATKVNFDPTRVYPRLEKTIDGNYDRRGTQRSVLQLIKREATFVYVASTVNEIHQYVDSIALIDVGRTGEMRWTNTNGASFLTHEVILEGVRLRLLFDDDVQKRGEITFELQELTPLQL